MTKDECTAFCLAIEAKLGNPRMTWDGPEPHDFRDMKARGVRFVNSELFYKVPDFVLGGQLFEDVSEYAPDGKMHFKILCGDEAAIADIGSRITAAGFEWRKGDPQEYFTALIFDVDVRVVNSAT